MNQTNLFTSSSSVCSTRILYTSSPFARSSLLHLQEVGSLQALKPYTSNRDNLSSYLFFLVEEGSGILEYGGRSYPITAGDCVFIDCKSPYAHSTDQDLWRLKWCHFYGPNISAIYHKYQERGGKAVFRPRESNKAVYPQKSGSENQSNGRENQSDKLENQQQNRPENKPKPSSDSQRINLYHQILTELYEIAASDDYVRDMRFHEKLSALLILLMGDAWSIEDAWVDTCNCDPGSTSLAVGIQQVKEYLDANYLQKITLDDLASRFFIVSR